MGQTYPTEMTHLARTRTASILVQVKAVLRHSKCDLTADVGLTRLVRGLRIITILAGESLCGGNFLGYIPNQGHES